MVTILGEIQWKKQLYFPQLVNKFWKMKMAQNPPKFREISVWKFKKNLGEKALPQKFFWPSQSQNPTYLTGLNKNIALTIPLFRSLIQSCNVWPRSCLDKTHASFLDFKLLASNLLISRFSRSKYCKILVQISPLFWMYFGATVTKTNLTWPILGTVNFGNKLA